MVCFPDGAAPIGHAGLFFDRMVDTCPRMENVREVCVEDGGRKDATSAILTRHILHQYVTPTSSGAARAKFEKWPLAEQTAKRLGYG